MPYTIRPYTSFQPRSINQAHTVERQFSILARQPTILAAAPHRRPAVVARPIPLQARIAVCGKFSSQLAALSLHAIG